MEMSLRLPKLLIVFISALSFVFSFMLAPISQAEASVSWGQEVTEVAKRYTGTPYQWGGTTPKGFDASGYTQYVFKISAAKISLPRTAKDQYKTGKSVQRKEVKEGDLVFFNTNNQNVSFVGIYLGKNKFIAATSKGVRIQDLNLKYWKDRYVGAKRVLKQ
ncbi:C40 family peptidase [Bacillus songklensis]|uniref:C40 family peptidase n=1 Tax=Bacillus songklensis TaxID=1069116 RepID=A0ABV8B6D3_9BACI